MKDNKVAQFFIGLILGVLLAFVQSIIMYPNLFFSSNNEESTSIKDDFWANINKEIIENNELESDKEYWSVFATKTKDKIDDKIEDIIKEIIKNEKEYNKNTDEYKICQLYNSIVKQENNLNDIDKYIYKIDNAKNINELITNISTINDELSLGIFINTVIQDDYVNNKDTVIMIAPFTFDYANIYSDYYTNPLYSSYVSTYIEYDRKILELYGYSKEEAKESVRKISRFYAEIANNSKSREELAEIKNYYNIISKNDLNTIFSNINIEEFINKYGNYKISIVDKKQAEALNLYFKEDNLETLKECAKKLPLSPGVYLMKNSEDKIIYIGKAKNLKNRVLSYFMSDSNHSEKVKKMVSNVDHFDYIVTDSEFEALVLECSLIKKYLPKYNILLKDDKGYSYVYTEQFAGLGYSLDNFSAHELALKLQEYSLDNGIAGVNYNNTNGRIDIHPSKVRIMPIADSAISM